LVFGARSAAAILNNHLAAPFPSPKASPRAPASPSAAGAPATSPADPHNAVEEARAILWDKVAIIRDGKHLAAAVKRLLELTIPDSETPSRQTCEASNILTVAPLIARCALAREESRGAHYRSDFPLKNESNPPRHSYVAKHLPPFFA
jgi:L-aspartate oxidase